MCGMSLLLLLLLHLLVLHSDERGMLLANGCSWVERAQENTLVESTWLEMRMIPPAILFSSQACLPTPVCVLQAKVLTTCTRWDYLYVESIIVLGTFAPHARRR